MQMSLQTHHSHMSWKELLSFYYERICLKLSLRRCLLSLCKFFALLFSYQSHPCIYSVANLCPCWCQDLLPVFTSQDAPDPPSHTLSENSNFCLTNQMLCLISWSGCQIFWISNLWVFWNYSWFFAKVSSLLVFHVLWITDFLPKVISWLRWKNPSFVGSFCLIWTNPAKAAWRASAYHYCLPKPFASILRV